MHSANVVRFALVCRGCVAILTHHHTIGASVCKSDVYYQEISWSIITYICFPLIRKKSILSQRTKNAAYKKSSPYSI